MKHISGKIGFSDVINKKINTMCGIVVCSPMDIIGSNPSLEEIECETCRNLFKKELDSKLISDAPIVTSSEGGSPGGSQSTD